MFTYTEYPLHDGSLSEYVAGVYTLNNPLGGCYVGIPSPHVGLSFVLTGHRRHAPAGQPLPSLSPVAYCRPLATKTTVCVSPNYSEITVVLKPLALHRLAYRPLPEGLMVALRPGEWLGSLFTTVREGCRGGKCVDKLMPAIEQLLRQRLAAAPADARLAYALDRIQQSNGAVTVEQLGAGLRVSCRTLYTLFTQKVGCTPKEYIRLTRFTSSLAYLHGHPRAEGALTECAFRFGYFDQSHFVKDFKYFTGKTPKNYLTISKQCRATPALGKWTLWNLPE